MRNSLLLRLFAYVVCGVLAWTVGDLVFFRNFISGSQPLLTTEIPVERISRWALSIVLWPLLIPSLLLGTKSIVNRIIQQARWIRTFLLAAAGVTTLLALLVTLLMAILNFDQMHVELAICYAAFTVAIAAFSIWDVMNIHRQIDVHTQPSEIE